MPKAFRSFSAILLAQQSTTPAVCETGDESKAGGEPNAAPSAADARGPAADPRVVDLLETFLAELTRLTARAAEVLEERAEALLADLARRVLGRELHIAPSDIDLLLRDMLSEFAIEKPLRLRVSEADAERMGSHRAVETDPGLAPGDFIVDVDDGSYDLRFDTRLKGMLASHRVGL